MRGPGKIFIEHRCTCVANHARARLHPHALALLLPIATTHAVVLYYLSKLILGKPY